MYGALVSERALPYYHQWPLLAPWAAAIVLFLELGPPRGEVTRV